MLRHRSFAALAVAAVLPLGPAASQVPRTGFGGFGAGPTFYENVAWSNATSSFWHVALAGGLFRSPGTPGEEVSRNGFAHIGSAYLPFFMAAVPQTFEFGLTWWRERPFDLDRPFWLDPGPVRRHFGWPGYDRDERIGSRRHPPRADDISTTATPEPATMTLVATGLAGLFGAARRKRRNSQS